MTVLITGGTGFIGAEVARQLRQRGTDPVAVFDLCTSTQRLDEIAECVQLIQGDLGNFSHVLDVVRQTQPSSIYHLGGMLSVPSEADPQAALHANVMGTFHVLEAARLFDVQQIIFASSRQTFGLGIEDEITDFTLQRPQLFYGACKLFCEHVGLFYRRKYGLDFRGIRYPAVVGPGARTPGVVQYTSWMIEESAKGKPFTVWVRPGTRAPILYYKDAARAALNLADAPRNGIQMVNYVLNGVQPTPSAEELAQVVRATVPGARITFEPDAELQAVLDRALLPIDDTCAREEWGWHAEYGLNDMVQDFVREVAENPQRYC